MTDSYAKWAAGLFEQAPDTWAASFFAIEHQQAPSQRQLVDALAHTPKAASAVTSIALKDLMKLWQEHTPDVIVAAGPGPFMLGLRARLDRTPWGRKIALVGGSPGIASHLSTEALRFRLALDLLLVASINERDTVASRMHYAFSFTPIIGLSTLPYIEGLQSRSIDAGQTQEFVFAAQPDIPQDRESRLQLLKSLLLLKRRNGLDSISIKLRAQVGEAQTHTEAHSYQDLFNELITRDEASRNEIRFVYGSMRDTLENPSTILATVSSSAAIEAIALGNPALIISDFGVNEENANKVFEDSGLVHRLDEIMLPYFEKADPTWKQRNYFHPVAENDWISKVSNLTHRTSPALSAKFSRQQLLKNAISEALRTDFPQHSASLFRAYRALFKR